jgi:capsular polysaccharide biosynthesis protein
MTLPGLDIGALRCASVLEPGFSARAVPLASFEGDALRGVRVDDVLYLPQAGLQLAPGGVAPLEAVQDPWCLDFETGRRFQGKLDALSSPFEADELDGEACVLGNFYSRNFFHWISEELVKVVLLERSGFDGRYVMNALPAFTGEFLGLLGVGPERIVVAQRPLRIRSAWYTTAISARRLHRYPGLFHDLRDALLRGVVPLAGSPRRIWMDRELGVNNPGRELLNPDEVYPLLDRYGFTVLDMAAHPVAGQLALASGAEALSGPHGAGFIHASFLAPRSAVIECFSPLFINPGIFEISRLLRHRYQMVAYENCYGGYQHGNRLMVDVSQLELALQALD